MDNIYGHVKDMFRFLNYAKNECNTTIELLIKECIRKIVLTDFTDEAGMINPTIKMIEGYNNANIHIYYKRTNIEKHERIDYNSYTIYHKNGIQYTIRYEDGINPDIEIVLNPGGEL